MHSLSELGFDALAGSDPGPNVGRVANELGDRFEVITDKDRSMVSLAGALRDDRPAVGDFVELNEEHTRIEHVIPRRTALVRQAAGQRTQAQVIAANIDVVFVVTSMNDEFNESRLERYIAVAWESGATPVVVLNKADLADDPDAFLDRAKRVALGVDVIALTAVNDGGATAIMGYLQAGKTYVLVGSSGVGKSTIVNAIIGEAVQDTGGIREDDDEGRHTTTRRDLIVLSEGRGILIDTPGMRELQLWDAEEGIAAAFEDIERLAAACRFRDCHHDGEPGCAIAQALQSGDLDARRLANYQKLQREAAFHERKRSSAAVRAESRRWAKMVKAATRKEGQ